MAASWRSRMASALPRPAVPTTAVALSSVALASAALVPVALAPVALAPMVAGTATAAPAVTASSRLRAPASPVPASPVPAKTGLVKTGLVRLVTDSPPLADAASFPAALSGIACRTLTHCIAVGVNTPAVATQRAGERWGGVGWHRLAMPKTAGAGDVSNGGVTCPADHECVAVGTAHPAEGPGYYAIAEYWDGSRWRSGKAADPGASSRLTAVSCPSATSCYAVGDYTPQGSPAFTPLIEHWDGAAWRQLTAPVPRGTSFGTLADVSCASRRSCVAVGTDGAGELIERWNGHHWSETTPPAPSSAMLYGVSCPSAQSCFAVGATQAPAGGSLVERWNGRAWSMATTPTPPGSSYPGLASVSCVSPVRCVAVGDDLNPGVYAVAWNGRAWRLIATTASGGKLGLFQQVRCLTATSCVALAATTRVAATQRSEAAFWNGSQWKLTSTP